MASDNFRTGELKWAIDRLIAVPNTGNIGIHK